MTLTRLGMDPILFDEKVVLSLCQQEFGLESGAIRAVATEIMYDAAVAVDLLNGHGTFTIARAYGLKENNVRGRAHRSLRETCPETYKEALLLDGRKYGGCARIPDIRAFRERFLGAMFKEFPSFRGSP